MFNEKFVRLLHIAEEAVSLEQYGFSDDEDGDSRWSLWWEDVKKMKEIIGWMIPLDVSRAARRNFFFNNDRPDALWLVEFLKNNDDKNIVYA